MNNLLPVVSIRNLVVVPNSINSIFISRPKSLAAIEYALEHKCRIVIATQTVPENDIIDESSNHPIGTLVNLQSVIRMPNGIAKIVIEGLEAVTVEKYEILDETLWCHFKARRWSKLRTSATVYKAAIIEQLDELRRSDKKEFEQVIVDYKDFSLLRLIYFVIGDLREFDLAARIEIFLTKSEKLAAERSIKLLESRLALLETSHDLRKKIKEEIAKSQKDFFLNEQIKAAQKELGKGDRTDQLLTKIQSAKLPKEAAEKAFEEYERLKEMPGSSMEAAMMTNYIETLINMPWNLSSEIKYDLAYAKKTLDEDHYGIRHVKESVLNYLAVQQRTKKVQGSILCLVGPPGVGKTSMAASIAKCTGREYIRMALGGLTDEAEIRGHRKTYVGAMCGRIMKKLEKAQVNNPLFLLDEIDKVGSNWRGDPASALLEVLDPEQNSNFADNYLDVPFDLSKVFFLCTANSTDIHPALLDRMDIIELSSYNWQEKLQICKQYIIPQQLKINGMEKKELKLTDKSIDYIIKNYTREAGVRNLNRNINKLARSIVRKNDEANEKKLSNINLDTIVDILGAPKFSQDQSDTKPKIGKVNGLAWTTGGGEMLPIEVLAIENGSGKVITTGSLGKVMQESIKAAISNARSRLSFMPIIKGYPDKVDIHIHMPSGAIPKDGPSAGVGMTIAIISAICQLPANNKVAVTGEISLLGDVLKIGGLREKLLAAQAEGIETVIIPKGNLVEVKNILDENSISLEIIGVDTIDKVWPYFFAKNTSNTALGVLNKQQIPKLVLDNGTNSIDSGKIFTRSN